MKWLKYTICNLIKRIWVTDEDEYHPHELLCGCEVDIELVPLVKKLWCMNINTIASCQGTSYSPAYISIPRSDTDAIDKQLIIDLKSILPSDTKMHKNHDSDWISFYWNPINNPMFQEFTNIGHYAHNDAAKESQNFYDDEVFNELMDIAHFEMSFIN